MQRGAPHRPARFQQREITRAILAAKAAGCDGVRIEIKPDGTMVITTGNLAEAAPCRNPFDEVL